MTEDTNPGAEASGSEPVNSPMSLDDAVSAYHTEPEADAPAVEEKAEQAVQGDSEPDDLALAEGLEEAEGEADEGDKPEAVLASDDMVVDVDGEKIPVADLKKSRLLEADYTRSKQALAQERGTLQELGKNFSGALERVVDYLASKLPPEPDPQLAYADPNRHYQMQILYNSAVAEMQGILAMREGAQQANSLLDETEFKARMSEADSEIVKQMPHLKDPKRFEAFTRRVQTGAKHYGFTDQEINTTADPRIRLMAYDAAYGREARANAAKAKAKVQEAKPMLPVQRAQHPNSVAALEAQNATRRLQKTGSLDDAVSAYMARS